MITMEQKNIKKRLDNNKKSAIFMTILAIFTGCPLFLIVTLINCIRIEKLKKDLTSY